MIATLILLIQNMFGRLALGVSIEPKNIKIACLIRTGKKWKLRALLSEPLNIQEQHSTNVQNLDNYLAICLRRAWMRLRIPNKKIAIAIAQRYVVTRQVPLPPNIQISDIEVALLAQAEKMLPYTIADIAMDYRFDAGIAHQATLAVCQKQQITRLTKLVHAAGLKLVAVEDTASSRSRGVQLRGNKNIQAMIMPDKYLDSAAWAIYDAGYDTACGMAVGGGFNLTPWRAQVVRKKNLLFMLSAFFVIVIAQLPIWIYHNGTQIERQKLFNAEQTLVAQITKLDNQIKNAKNLKIRYQQQHQRHQIIALWTQANGWLKQILEQLPSGVSGRLRLEQLRLATPVSEIRGYAKSPSDVSAFAQYAERIPAIRKVELTEIRATEKALGHRFSIRLWINLQSL